MKKLMKYVSIVLSLALIVGSISFNAFADDPIGPTENQYQIFFDNRGRENLISSGGTKLESGGIYSFTKDEKIEFSMNIPEERWGLRPIIDAEIFDGDEQNPNTHYSSEGETPDINISSEDNWRTCSFDFTPKVTTPFMINIWWSEYDRLDKTEDSDIRLEINSHLRDVDMNTYVAASSSDVPEYDRSAFWPNGDRCWKGIYASNSEIEVMIDKTVDEISVSGIIINQDFYGDLGEPDKQKPLSELNQDDEHYLIPIPQDTYIEIFFGGGAPGPQEELHDNQFSLSYASKPYPDKSKVAKVSVATSSGAESYDIEAEADYVNTKLDFAADSMITFSLLPAVPEDLDSIDFEIEVFDGDQETPNSRYRTNWEDADASRKEYNLTTYSKTEGRFVLEFTPASEKPFRAQITWSDEDRYYQFECHDDEAQIAFDYEGAGHIELNQTSRPHDRAAISFRDSQEMTHYKQNVLNSAEEVMFNVCPGDGSEVETIETNYLYNQETTGDMHKISEDPSDFVFYDGTNAIIHVKKDAYIEGLCVYVHFNGSAGPEPGELTGDWKKLSDGIQKYIFAYGSEKNTPEDIKNDLKRDLSEELANRHINADYSVAQLMLASSSEFISGTCLIDKITIGDQKPKDDTCVIDAPYYDFDLRIATESIAEVNRPEEEVVIQQRVYLLNNITDIIIEHKYFDVEDHTGYVIAHQIYQDGFDCDRYVYANWDNDDRGDANINIYGNGAMAVASLDTGNDNVLAAHITQEHCGDLPKGRTGERAISCRLIVTKEPNCIHYSYEDKKDAANWNFANVGIVPISRDVNNPTVASIFYGSQRVTLDKAVMQNDAGSQIDSISLVGDYQNQIIIENQNTVVFNTNYDEVIVQILYKDSDSSEGFIKLQRVGLGINSCGGDGTHLVLFHGTDQSIRYDMTERKAIIGSFYYDDTTELKFDDHDVYQNREAYEEAVKATLSSLGDANPVSLYVTITKGDAVTRKILTLNDAITIKNNATAVDNGKADEPITDTGSVAPGYAGQGGCHFYEDFVLWAGSEEEFRDITSVSAIVVSGNMSDDAFGGVRIGSGAGVTWINE